MVSNTATHGESGAAMIAALWLSLILALLSLVLISMSRESLLETKVNVKLERAWLDAQSGASIGAHNLSSLQNVWRADGRIYDVDIDGAAVYVSITSPQGQIDLNASSSAFLAQFFTRLGYKPDRAAKLGDAIVDWRDVDDLVRLNGAEQIAYKSAGRSDGPTNRLFRSVDELGDVLGVTPDVMRCISPYLTVYSNRPSPVSNYVTGELRSILGLAPLGQGQSSGARQASLAGQVYVITADAPYSEHSAARVIWTIRYSGKPNDPIWTHHLGRTIIPVNIPEQSLDKPLGACPIHLEQSARLR